MGLSHRTLSSFALTLLPAGLIAAPADFLTDVRVRIEAARYAPTERDLHWTTWIGAGVGLVRVRNVTAYGSADLETILGTTLRTFDANQANYHLQLGLRGRVGSWEVGPFFHHVSRHYVDRAKTRAVDWNLLGVTASGHPGILGTPLRILVSVARTTQVSLPGYEWELLARAEGDVFRRAWGEGYLRGEARSVIAHPSAALSRGDFLDFALEGGARLLRGSGAFEAFVAFERRNDVFLEEPGSRDRALLGIRILYTGR